MSFPFGGHPTLEQFLEFAKNLGCSVQMVFLQPDDAAPYQTIEIMNPNGGRVVVVDIDLKEYLTTSMVTYLQRRLGIKSTFAAAPEPPSEGD